VAVIRLIDGFQGSGGPAMTMPLGRREFLKQNVAAGVLLGFPFLVPEETAAGADAAPAPATGAELLAQARQRMAESVRPGVVIVIPPDAKAAQVLAADLGRLLGADDACEELVVRKVRVMGPQQPAAHGPTDPTVQRLFCQGVFVCVPFADVQKAFPDLKPGTAAVLLNAEGRAADCAPAEAGLFGKDVAVKLTQFLHGAKGERLAAAAAAQREALGTALSGQLDAALRDLDADGFAEREAASKKLAELAPRAPALLAAALRDATELEPRRRLERLFTDLYQTEPPAKGVTRLPYGVRFESVHVDPCPGCGMGTLPPGSRQFVRFITDKPEKKK
jgi:hypothetical protein